VLGVHTGFIFGVYEYGPTLGPALLSVPVMMGVNWLMLIYMIGHVSLLAGAGRWGRSVLGAALMVLMDVLIEPFAVRFDMWQWAGDQIPFQNYLAWFLISWVMLRYFHAHNLSAPNPVALPLFLIQLGFFASFML
jgi:putative membrane protein